MRLKCEVRNCANPPHAIQRITPQKLEVVFWGIRRPDTGKLRHTIARRIRGEDAHQLCQHHATDFERSRGWESTEHVRSYRLHKTFDRMEEIP